MLDNSSQHLAGPGMGFNAPNDGHRNQSTGQLRHGGASLDDTLAISQAHLDSFEF